MRVDIADLAFTVEHLFISGERLPDLEEANINGDTEGLINLADVSLLVDYLFNSFPELPLCPVPPNAPPVTELFGPVTGYLYIDGSRGNPVAGIPVN